MGHSVTRRPRTAWLPPITTAPQLGEPRTFSPVFLATCTFVYLVAYYRTTIEGFETIDTAEDAFRQHRLVDMVDAIGRYRFPEQWNSTI
jgi:hypothetical protein